MLPPPPLSFPPSRGTRATGYPNREICIGWAPAAILTPEVPGRQGNHIGIAARSRQKRLAASCTVEVPGRQEDGLFSVWGNHRSISRRRRLLRKPRRRHLARAKSLSRLLSRWRYPVDGPLRATKEHSALCTGSRRPKHPTSIFQEVQLPTKLRHRASYLGTRP